MSSSLRVALVTGSNQGIGFEIVKGLAKRFDGVVYLTARSVEKGEKAVKQLEAEGIKVNFHQLDIDDQNSIDSMAAYLKEKYSGLDVLVNNAAIAFWPNSEVPVATQVESTIRVDYFGTLNVCKAFFPLLRPHARVVHVSSRMGTLNTFIKDPKWKEYFLNENASIEDINKIAKEYVNLARDGSHTSICMNSYCFSKAAINAVTKIQQRAFNNDKREDIIVNAVCPGYCATAINNYSGYLSPAEGAITITNLALLPPNASGPKGEFWGEMQPCDPNWSLSAVIPNANLSAFTE